jgi:hypothetical protein
VPPAFYKAISQDLARSFAAGVFLKDGPPKGDAPPRAPNPLSDPAAMDGMMAGMKTQMVRAAHAHAHAHAHTLIPRPRRS